MICDHYTKECDSRKCTHKPHHARTDMCCRGDSCTCTHINQHVNCLAETEIERFHDWWSDTYKVKLGSTMIELAFMEVAWKTWEARAAQNEFVAKFFSQPQHLTKELLHTVLQKTLQAAPAESNAKYLLRQLFYFRGPLGVKVEELIGEQDHNLWKEIYKELENPDRKMGGF